MKLEVKNFYKLEDVDYFSTAAETMQTRTDKIIYLLKPDTFKTILIRNKKLSKYDKYSILLEKCIKHYSRVIRF